MDDPLTRVFWIGGGSAGGKSTLARRLAVEYGLIVCSTDEMTRSFARELAAERTPLLQRFLAMDMDERWVDRSPREMLRTFHWFEGEGFDRLISEVRAVAADGPVVVEGFHLLPRLLEPLLSERRRAVWVLATPDFRARVMQQRVVVSPHFLQRTNDPPVALANLLERDHLFTEHVRVEADRLGLASVEVDGSRTVDDHASELAGWFGLS